MKCEHDDSDSKIARSRHPNAPPLFQIVLDAIKQNRMNFMNEQFTHRNESTAEMKRWTSVCNSINTFVVSLPKDC